MNINETPCKTNFLSGKHEMNMCWKNMIGRILGVNVLRILLRLL